MSFLINPYVFAGGGGTGPDGNYQFHRSITIDSTKVPNTNQSDFPMLFSGTFAYLKTVANGGNVESASGFDIIFSSDEAGETVLDHEIETYNASTGVVNFWVKIPTLTTATDTVIYIHYGNASISSSQEDVAGVWSSNFALVMHLADGSSLDLSDSSPNGHTPVNEGTVAAIAGQIDGGADFPAGGSSGVQIEDTVANSPTAAMSLSMWFKRASLSGGDHRSLVNKGDGATLAGSSYELIFNPSDLLRFEVSDGSAWKTAEYSTAINDTTTWHLVHGTYDGSNVRIYTEGVLRTTTAFTGSINDIAGELFLGRVGGGAFRYDGIMDEVRIAGVARSADWITTEFNNQSSPGTFYSVSGEL